MSDRILQSDCQVIGAGLAGSAHALHLAPAGHNVHAASLNPRCQGCHSVADDDDDSGAGS